MGIAVEFSLHFLPYSYSPSFVTSLKLSQIQPPFRKFQYTFIYEIQFLYNSMSACQTIFRFHILHRKQIDYEALRALPCSDVLEMTVSSYKSYKTPVASVALHMWALLALIFNATNWKRLCEVLVHCIDSWAKLFAFPRLLSVIYSQSSIYLNWVYKSSSWSMASEPNTKF